MDPHPPTHLEKHSIINMGCKKFTLSIQSEKLNMHDQQTIQPICCKVDVAESWNRVLTRIQSSSQFSRWCNGVGEVYEVYFIRCSDTLHAKRLFTFTHDNNLGIHKFKTCPNYFRFFRLRESANLDDSLGSMIRATCVVSPDVCTNTTQNNLTQIWVWWYSGPIWTIWRYK